MEIPKLSLVAMEAENDQAERLGGGCSIAKVDRLYTYIAIHFVILSILIRKFNWRSMDLPQARH